jgi:hypothetical protein
MLGIACAIAIATLEHLRWFWALHFPNKPPLHASTSVLADPTFLPCGAVPIAQDRQRQGQRRRGIS